MVEGFAIMSDKSNQAHRTNILPEVFSKDAHAYCASGPTPALAPTLPRNICFIIGRLPYSPVEWIQGQSVRFVLVSYFVCVTIFFSSPGGRVGGILFFFSL